MTDEPETSEEELQTADAKRLADLPIEKIADAADLPDDVRDGKIEE